MGTIKISRPCTPSTVLETKEIKATEVLVSWGGGLGGASKKYYSISENNNDYEILPHGEFIELNPNFIVHKKDVKIVKMVTKTTNSYYTKGDGEVVITDFHLIPSGSSYVIDDHGLGGSNKNTIDGLRIIRRN